MLRDNLVGLIEPMLSGAGAYPLALRTNRKQSSDDRPVCLENPRPAGAESTLTENVASPFHAEPGHGKEVVLTSENLAPQITVRLRHRGGVLLGAVTDKFTGRPIKKAWVSYADIDGKAAGSSVITSDGQICLAVPTECDLVIIV